MLVTVLKSDSLRGLQTFIAHPRCAGHPCGTRGEPLIQALWRAMQTTLSPGWDKREARFWSYNPRTQVILCGALFFSRMDAIPADKLIKAVWSWRKRDSAKRMHIRSACELSWGGAFRPESSLRRSRPRSASGGRNSHPPRPLSSTRNKCKRGRRKIFIQNTPAHDSLFWWMNAPTSRKKRRQIAKFNFEYLRKKGQIYDPHLCTPNKTSIAYSTLVSQSASFLLASIRQWSSIMKSQHPPVKLKFLFPEQSMVLWKCGPIGGKWSTCRNCLTKNSNR